MSFVAELSDLGQNRLQSFVIDTVSMGAAASARASTKMRNLHPPKMKKLLLLPLLVVVCLVGDTSFRVIATTATTVTESTLSNISTRAFVQTGDNVVIGGFIVEERGQIFTSAAKEGHYSGDWPGAYSVWHSQCIG